MKINHLCLAVCGEGKGRMSVSSRSLLTSACLLLITSFITLFILSTISGEAFAHSRSYYASQFNNQITSNDTPPHRVLELDKSFSSYEGLSDTTVFSMVQDKQGFLWFGTVDGLNRYDGTQFKVFRHDSANPSSISSSLAGNLFIDSKDRLWVGTWGGGANRYDASTETFTRFRHRVEDPTSISADRVQSFFEDKEHRLWMGTNGGGLNLFEEQLKTFTRYEHDKDNPHSISNNRVWSIIQAPDGNLWVGTSDGLNYFDIEREVFKTVPFYVPHINSSDQNEARTLLIDNKARLWVGSEGQLSYLDPHTETFVHVPFPHGKEAIVNHLIEDGSQGIWVATMTGLLYLDLNTLSFLPLSEQGEFIMFANKSIKDVHQDASGMIWITTAASGVKKLRIKQQVFESKINYHEALGLSGAYSQISSMLTDDSGVLWLGTRGGVILYDPSTNTFTALEHAYQQKLDSVIWRLAKSYNGNIWISASNGVYLFDFASKTLVDYRATLQSLNISNIVDIHEDKNKQVWFIEKDRGLVKWSPEDNSVERFTSHADHTFFYQDSLGRFWLGSNDSGLSLFLPEHKTFQYFSYDMADKRSLNGNWVTDILQARDGTIWVATHYGLNQMLSLDGTFKRYDTNNGLVNRAVQSILQDENDALWLSTRRGLVRFDHANDQFTFFSKSDGLHSDAFSVSSAYIDPNGKLYFSGHDGFTAFYPKDISVNQHKPNTVVTQVLVDNEPVQFINNEIHLNVKNKSITFKFSSLDYVAPEENLYSYKMEGYDEEWLPVSRQRTATYTNLDLGEYVFQVQGSNNAGIFGSTAVIKIYVPQPWWESIWLKLVGILCLLGLTYLWQQRRVRRICEINQKLELKVSERTAELQSRTFELKAANEQLTQLSLTDFLTKLPNRRGFQNEVDAALVRFKRNCSTFSIAIADIDHFKQFNDNYGHKAGDYVLRSVAKVLKASVREQDVVARWGGEEFIFLFPDTNITGAKLIAEKIRVRIQNAPFEYEEHQFDVTLTFGVCQYAAGVDFDTCLNRADEALYKGKKSGRNKVVIDALSAYAGPVRQGVDSNIKSETKRSNIDAVTEE
ncbi:ligand-binding sensor domain-containing protein [Flocculibacter collagenilyticus]|uniref:ligand-binding sensor domain-containing protein n=1 Tax=Flocculibacter collagenilyticus TaxID=2744479 RepID=UPI0018F41AC9|nr:ligand-binding sensor domain-containing diguanylate cyclase [Flocculibacter collagenilyticus]